jgi:periplasmic protein TonB
MNSTPKIIFMHTQKTTPGIAVAVLAIAASITMASCFNDSNSAAADKITTDSIAALREDSSKIVQPIAKKRNGKASASLIAGNSLKVMKDKAGVYSMAEKMPEYPGGEKALSAFVENNTNYPQDAMDQGTEGTVHVSFVIDENGKVVNAVAGGKTAGHGLEEEAIKIVEQMPARKPGLVKGKPVKTRLTLPVTFKLADA